MFGRLLSPLFALRSLVRLPPAANAERKRDRAGLRSVDPGILPTVQAALGWLCQAQDGTASRDGGVARHYSLVTGWSTSYPETTGYLIPTFLTYARGRRREDLRQRAKRMLDWLLSIQLPDGGFQGGTVDATPVVPVAFNTGQILLGLASGVREFGNTYRPALRRAADWLVAAQDADGCWRRFSSPFAMLGEKTYDTHVAWALAEAAEVEGPQAYLDAALANVTWAVRLQRENGWIAQCCLTDPARPLTHTLGYALRGVLEVYRISRDPALLEAGRKTADGILTALRPDGFLPGRLAPDWRGSVRWACLTGSAQIAHCWLLLYQYTADVRYREAAYSVNHFLRRTVRIDGPAGIRGGVKGSFPVDGGYGTFEYLNWAAKFFIDAQLLEDTVRNSEPMLGR